MHIRPVASVNDALLHGIKVCPVLDYDIFNSVSLFGVIGIIIFVQLIISITVSIHVVRITVVSITIVLTVVIGVLKVIIGTFRVVVVLRLVETADLLDLVGVAARGALPGKSKVLVNHAFKEDLDVTGIVFVGLVDSGGVLIAHVRITNRQLEHEVGIMVILVEDGHLLFHVGGHLSVLRPLKRRGGLFFFRDLLSGHNSKRYRCRNEFHL